MDDAGFESKLDELVNEIDSITTPERERLIKLGKQASSSHKQLRESLGRLQEVLDSVRIAFKYQLFDLEATRRENLCLKELLEDQHS